MIRKLIEGMFQEELDIQHKLLNLILSAAFAGGLISLFVSIVIGFQSSAVITIGLLIAVVGFALWIANKKKKPQVAAFLLVVSANMIIFPIMYFTNGGMASGMPVWLVLGMIFSWLILRNPICFIMYALNAIAVVGCILMEQKWPELVIPMASREAAYWDLVQSMIIVTCIFGLIFKYQTYVYEKQKKQILKANQAKSEFLANMSHEVRTPIHAMMGYNEMIIKESRESQIAAYALNVQSAGRILLSSVNSILEFTNMEKNEMVLKREAYSTLEVLQDVVTYAENYVGQKGIELRFIVDENIPQTLSGDAVRLTQIMDNLISNAAKYTKEGYVEVRLQWEMRTEGEGVLAVQVQDTGIGMKQEDVRQISQSFVRFDNQQTRNIQGIGLGLTIVTRLLQLMNSELRVESEFGKGSTFSFEVTQEVVENIPIGKYERNRIYSYEEVGKDEIVEAPEARILVVDDNQMNLDLLKGMLKATKMQVDVGENGEDALFMVRKKRYDMILMDHMMPVMDGLEALQKMKEEKLCEHTPVIVLTANAVGNARENYLQAGFDDYLAKPIVSSQLYAIIKRFLPEECYLREEEGLLGNLTFLDTETGMQYCCNNEEFYKEMLGSYLKGSKYDQINRLYQEEAWDDYRILVHALKSTSLSIGAVKVSEEAKKLESAAKEDRISYIKENHQEVMALYKELLNSLSRALEEKNKPAVKEISGQSEEREHILVVDDDRMNLQIAEKMLGDSFSVDCVTSGVEALNFLKDQIPQLILLDLHMPDMDGFAVIRELKKNDRTQHIPVIFLTADNDKDIEVKGFREGALDFITKPFVADIMLQRIKRILELDRLQKDLQTEVKKQTKKAEERREKVEKLSLQIMLTLANTIDAKDKYTNGHSVRVAEYSREIAKRVGKTQQEQEDIYYAGLLHDIGKIGISDNIINKASGLTDEEYDIIGKHPQIGADILENMSEIPGLAVGAHWHHEKYNGEGYPDGLKGDEIPEVARIIGVADAYDAMASKRSYRDTLPQHVVREEIVKGSGTQFDPRFADVMIQMIDEDTEYLMQE